MGVVICVTLAVLIVVFISVEPTQITRRYYMLDQMFVGMRKTLLTFQ